MCVFETLQKAQQEAAPFMTVLFASEPPAVKIISSGSQFKKSAIFWRASSTICFTFLPVSYSELGLP